MCGKMKENENTRLYKRITEAFPALHAEANFSFRSHTTIGLGGIASVAVSPSTTDECAKLLSYFKRERIAYCFLGAGANVLPSDGYFDGAVVRFQRLKCTYLEGTQLYVGAGINGTALCSLGKSASVSGFEPFIGIPFTVGGGVAMNAGIAQSHFEDVVVRVTAVDGGKIRTFSAKECAFQEKDSVFLREKIAITGVLLKGKYAPRKRISENECFYRMRRSGLPKGRSMGCVFVNPSGISAGRLIEECGLKGTRIGGARISEIHANFIINEGGTFQDVALLIDYVKREVANHTRIVLREEIRRIP